MAPAARLRGGKQGGSLSSRCESPARCERGSPLALPWANPTEVGDWLRRLARADRGALLGRSPLHAVLAGLLLAGVAGAAVTGAVSDYTVVTEDLHEWLGEAALVVVGAHIGVVLLSEAARRIARTGWALGGGKPAASRGGQA